MKKHGNEGLYIELLDYLLKKYSNNTLYRKKWEVDDINESIRDDIITVIFTLNGEKYKGTIILQLEDVIISDFDDITIDIFMYNSQHGLIMHKKKIPISDVTDKIDHILNLGLLNIEESIPFYLLN